MDYATLKQAIRDYVQSDETTFNTQLPVFISNAEDRVYRSIQLPTHWKSSAEGNLSITGEATTPVGAVEVYGVRVSGASAGDSDGPWSYLLKKDWDFLYESYPGIGGTEQTGVPLFYAVSSASISSSEPVITIKVAPYPSTATYIYVIDYYGKVAADVLSDTTTETWLSVTFPDVLLYGALSDAYFFLKSEPEKLQYCEQRFSDALGSLAVTATQRRGTVNENSPGPR